MTARATLLASVHRLPAGTGFGLLTGALMLPIAGYGAANTARTVARLLDDSGAMVDFLAFYTGARLLLEAPGHLYDPQAWGRVQLELHVLSPPMEFWNPPQTALLLAPLAVLPFVPAYLVWLGVNLVCLASACYLLEPRCRQSWSWRLRWLVVVVLFLPAQLSLLMGQLAFVLLLGFALFVRFAERADWIGTAVSLIPWTCKPQLLPPFLIALALQRSWRAVCLACALPVVLSWVVIVIAGPGVILEYAQLALGAGGDVLSSQARYLGSGQGVLGISQWVLGRTWLASGTALVATLGVYALVGHAWRRGLRDDAERNIQMAMLPIAAFVTSPHALPYDAVPWLGSLWLMLAFAQQVPQARGLVLASALIGGWGANLAALPGLSAIAPVAGLTAIVELAIFTWLLHHARSVGRPDATVA